MRRPLLALLLCLAVTGCGDDDEGPPDPGRFDEQRAFADLEAQVEFGPRPTGSAANRRQAQFLAQRLRDAGVSDVRIQRPFRNVVGAVPGSEGDAILLAAHHDTLDLPGFVGANDGASGVAAVLEIARALPERVEGPTVLIALFDAEEARPGRSFELDGLRGSRQYVDYARRGVQGVPPLRRIDAMILLDLVGDCDLQIPREANSGAGLYASIAEHATGDSPFGGEAPGIVDDHTPVLHAGVTAVDLIDFTFGPGSSPGEWWHTSEDTLDRVCPESLDAVGEAVLGALQEAGGPSGGE